MTIDDIVAQYGPRASETFRQTALIVSVQKKEETSATDHYKKQIEGLHILRRLIQKMFMYGPDSMSFPGGREMRGVVVMTGDVTGRLRSVALYIESPTSDNISDSGGIRGLCPSR